MADSAACVCSETTLQKSNTLRVCRLVRRTWAGVAAMAAASAWAAGAPLQLHAPSPDWRDQVLYFVMTDRFADGDPANNDQGAGEYKPGDRTRYQGGDLRGLQQRLAYIRGLGATGVWITPPVANQWLDPAGHYTSYHGYWAENFKRLDPHLGTLDDYKALSHALHSQGMVLVQDIVVNHTGNFFGYSGWQRSDPALGYTPNTHTRPVPRPSQPPFDQNDPRDPAHRAAGIYHWTPDITDYTDPEQERRFQMGGLDDLATDNPVVRRALRESYGHWVREVGVDAFRVDTAFYVAPEYFTDFMRARDPLAPGLAEVARRTGRRDFFVFGEGFGIDRPGQDAQARKIESYVRGPRGEPRLPGMLNFPLYGALGDAFARGRPPAELGDRITRMLKVHSDPHRMVSFIDNHDVDRFLAGGSVAGLKQALLAMMTLPGVPVLYYGTEQGFTEPRASMFAAGWGSGGRDRYDTEAPLYRAIAEMTQLRRTHRVLSRGWPTVLHGNAATPGALAWRMDWRGPEAQRRKPAERQPVFVVFNTAESDTLLPALATGLPAGTVLEGLHGLEGRPADAVVGAGGLLTLRLPPRSGQVWRATARRAAPAVVATRVQLALAGGAVQRGDFEVSGTVSPAVPRLQLVVDGDLARALEVQPDASGRWQARVDTAAMVDPATEHSVVAWAEGQAVSAPRSFRVERMWQTVLDQPDPAGDDTGPPGAAYTYPTDPGWGENRQMDLRRVRVETAGGALRLHLGLHRITTPWSPPNGFDHVNFTVYIELPGVPGGATVMPLQNASLPGGMRWHLRLRAGGWSNALHGAEGASATNEGTPVTPSATLAVDRASNTVSFTLPAAALGRLPSLRGARIYVTTWDYDGGYRALGPEPRAYAMGGGREDGPRVMDESGVLTLP
ncbi:hypothetical protein EOE66_03850 [Rubrivivax rivuli]|uniref:Glycosyl hydrolase family 13 catalytic domain-containing protein n=2 Tax=Rubrivivax rivuli TaxID=1862385 RepID=A0A437RSG4_9BURK|nr:hypothetical protein EOE66_03850 [Rubrivivax rivuli]